MKNVLGILLVGAFACIIFGFTFAPKSSIEGTWIGEVKTPYDNLTIRTHFWTEEGELRGSIDIPREGTFDFPLKWIIIDSTNVHFELVQNSGTLVFDGELRSGRICGDFFVLGNRGSFQLTQAAPVNQ